MRNKEEMQEWHNEMKDEARRDELHEYNMRTDFDYFLDYILDEREEFTELYYNIKKQFESNGWDTDDFLEGVLI